MESTPTTEAVEAALAAIERGDTEINACCDVRPEAALAAACALEDRLAAGEDPGPLAGVPIGVKDLEHAAGFRTTYGDPAHGDDPDQPEDSLQVARLRAAGAIVVTKTNTPAYGVHAETDNLLFGPTRNPWALSRTAGGSSGGSAAAVAAGLLPLATGSDGGGSIRIPSAVCGISGFKVTSGVVPTGTVDPPTWGTFSTRGPMARTLAEIAVGLDAVKGFTAYDLHSVEVPGSFVDAVASASLEGIRIAWLRRPGIVEPEARVLDVLEGAMKALEGHGAVVDTVEDVFPHAPVHSWARRAAAGSWRVMNEDDAPWDERFLPDAQTLARFGEHVSGPDILRGDAGAHLAGRALATLFERFDVLALPGMGGPPPHIGEPHPLGPGWAGDFTLAFNLTGSPAAVVPAGTVDDDGDTLPVALQLAAPRLSDLALMRVAAAAEAVLGPPQRPPRG